MEKEIYAKIQEALEDVKANGLIRQDVAGKDYIGVINIVLDLLEIEHEGTYRSEPLAKT